MKYKILKGDYIVNTIESDAEFVASYCEKNEYTYEPIPEAEPEVEPTTEELLDIILGV